MLKSIYSRRFASDLRHKYQRTLNLAKTQFPNRSDLRRSLELIPEYSDNVYKKQLKEFISRYNEINEEEKKLQYVKDNLFVLHDGPPYANGELHMGHALNKILKDFINRFQLSQGKAIFYKPGWDCHGLPIEMKALKDLSEGIDDTLKVRKLARNHALKSLDKQRSQFRKYGILTDWDAPYITMDKTFEIHQLQLFRKMFKDGLIKRQNKPVYWGTETRTALAESELEYNENHVSTAAYVRFPLLQKSCAELFSRLNISKLNESISCLIWTSTPWTLFSNRAICYNENFNYVLAAIGKQLIIVESNLLSSLPKDNEPVRIIAEFRGELLKELRYENPLTPEFGSCPLLHGDHVTDNAGTGLVHTAPGHGHDDYFLGIQNNLEIYSPVDHEGRYNLEDLPESCKTILTDSETGRGKKVLVPETTKTILNLLSEKQMLYQSHKYSHSYPYDWRAKKPVIIRATPQWFADLHDVKGLALKSLENVEFYPKRGVNRLSSFIKSRNEWCISRQRSWGVPIPVFHKKENADQILINDDILKHIIQKIEKDGIEAWFDPNSNVVDWLPDEFKSVANDYVKGTDTMDVWFDSGSTWTVIKDFYEKELKLKKLPEPLSSVYLEGSDQHRGWFQSSLLTKVSSSLSPVAPYKEVITHGFTLDEKGIKMSKSIGNTISPEAIIEGDKSKKIPNLGIDGLRYFVAQADYTTDISVGPTVLKHVAEALKKCRLTLRFLISNLEISKDYELLPINQLRDVDKYTLFRLNSIIEETLALYKEHNFSKALVSLQFHMNNELSSFYFDISKDSLYSDSVNALKRKQIQTTLFHIYDSYRAILAPILPSLVQESWNYLPKEWLQTNNEQHPSLRPWPKFAINSSEITNFEQIVIPIRKQFKELFNKASNDSITKSTQISVDICYTKDMPYTNEELCDILQVANVNIKKVETVVDSNAIKLPGGNNISIKLNVSDLHKCPRCWKHNSKEEDTLCLRCETAIKDCKNISM